MSHMHLPIVNTELRIFRKILGITYIECWENNLLMKICQACEYWCICTIRCAPFEWLWNSETHLEFVEPVVLNHPETNSIVIKRDIRREKFLLSKFNCWVLVITQNSRFTIAKDEWQFNFGISFYWKKYKHMKNYYCTI